VLQSVPGVRVPEGFIITTAGYWQFVAGHPSLERALQRLDDLSDAWLAAMRASQGLLTPEIQELEAQIAQQSVHVREAFLAAPLHPALQAPLAAQYRALGGEEAPVAVRSSATAEDLPQASFAGQHDSFLNQKGEEQLARAVVACWASLFHPYTVQYRNQLRLTLSLGGGAASVEEGLRHTRVGLAVVVQRSLRSAVAGVGFNVSPSGESRIHIEANYGLGETVVSGAATPDAWEVDSDAQTLLAAVLGDKEIQAVTREDGDLEQVPVQEIDRHRFSMSEERVMEVARAVRDIGVYYREQFGYPFIDTEFAIDQEGVLYFVQARPETVFSSSTSLEVEGVVQESAADAEVLFHGGSAGYPGAHAGRLVYARTPQEALEKTRQGDILVTTKTTPEWTIVFPKLGGIIVDVGGVLSHTAIVGRERRIPTLLSTADATRQLAERDGEIVTLDAINSVVYAGALETASGEIETFVRPDLQLSGPVQDLEMQTHRVDEEGKWMSRPNRQLTPMQLDLLQRAYDAISERLELKEPIRHKVIHNQMYVQVEDAEGRLTAYGTLADVFLKWGLDRLEGLFNHRVETVRQLQELADHFEATPAQLRQLQRVYQDWFFHFLSRGRFGHGAVASLMQQCLERIPDPALLSPYLHARYPMQNLSEEKQQEHARLAAVLIELGVKKGADPEAVKAVLQAEHPAVWQEITVFAESYEHAAAEDMTAPVPTDVALQQLLLTLGDEAPDDTPASLTVQQLLQMDLLFARDTELARTMALAHQHLYQKENEHHIVARAQHQIRQGLLQLGQALVAQGALTDPERIFEYTIEEVIRFVEDHCVPGRAEGGVLG
jgi:phosphohistidine swiveling domain-containing protein